MKKKKGVRAYSLGGILLILLVVVLFGCGVLSVSLPQCAGKDKNVNNAVSSVMNANGVSDKDDVSTEEQTYKYLTLPLQGVSGWSAMETDFLSQRTYFLYEVRSNNTQRVSGVTSGYVRLDGITNDANDTLFCSFSTLVSFPAVKSNDREFIFQRDLTINVRDSYYEILKKQEGNIKNIKITLYANGVSLDLFSTAVYPTEFFEVSGAKVFEDTEYIPGYEDNGGEDPNNNLSFLEQMYNWLVANVGWKTSFTVFKIIFWSCIALVVGGILTFIFVKAK